MNDYSFTFYFGAASGSSRKVLQALEEPNVMINYATHKNQPWEGIEKLFIDCGGYSFMHGHGEYNTSDEDYIDYIEEKSPDFFALRDYPCEEEVLGEHGRTVRDHQRMTTERHISLMDIIEDRNLDSKEVSVIQGWTEQEYLEHIDELSDYGLIRDYVAIGSVCRRGQNNTIRGIIDTVHSAVPQGTNIHAFGVKQGVLKFPDTVKKLSSSDSLSYDLASKYEDSGKWKDMAFHYLKQKRKIESLIEEATLEKEYNKATEW